MEITHTVEKQKHNVTYFQCDDVESCNWYSLCQNACCLGQHEILLSCCSAGLMSMRARAVVVNIVIYRIKKQSTEIWINDHDEIVCNPPCCTVMTVSFFHGSHLERGTCRLPFVYKMYSLHAKCHILHGPDSWVYSSEYSGSCEHSYKSIHYKAQCIFGI